MAATSAASATPWANEVPTAVLVLADGTVIEGRGLGATGSAVAEVCFNTALTGYQEILTDPSYAGQIVTFTFPHIGNVGTNEEDIEDLNPAARAGASGAVFRASVTNPSNYRAAGDLDAWLKRRGIIAISGIDTRALTATVREKGAPNAVIAHSPDGKFDIEALKAQAKAWSGLVGLDLAKEVTSGQSSRWSETPWAWNEGHGEQTEPTIHVVAIDYGVKRNILRLLAGLGARVTVVPATTSASDILAMKPDGIFLSNGPGDRQVYLDTSFFRELEQRFGAAGDFAEAYVIAHEVGHHVQNLIGVLPKFNEMRQSMSEGEANAMSVRVELQADCFAGIWGHYTDQKGLLEQGDVEEALNAATQIGDDTIQKRTQGYIVPESFNHGTSEQRRTWFQRGFESGRLSDCDTFNNPV